MKDQPKSVESDSENTDSDPEEAAERDYALQHGLPFVSIQRDGIRNFALLVFSVECTCLLGVFSFR